MNGEERALTKKDLVEALGAMKQEYDGKVAALEARLRDTETKLNTALNRFSKSSHERVGQLEDFSSSATRRLAALEAATLWPLELRFAEIEKKLDRRQ
jgi:predicted  nucleic acid-binding Zn-ribbon protein